MVKPVVRGFVAPHVGFEQWHRFLRKLMKGSPCKKALLYFLIVIIRVIREIRVLTPFNPAFAVLTLLTTRHSHHAWHVPLLSLLSKFRYLIHRVAGLGQQVAQAVLLGVHTLLRVLLHLAWCGGVVQSEGLELHQQRAL